MPPPVKDPEAAWSAGTPIESFWLENPKVSLAGDLSAAQERALDLLVKFNGQIKPEKDPVWKEPSDGTWTLADTAADLRARLIGAVLAELSAGRAILFGYVARDGVIIPDAKPTQLAASILAVDQTNPRELVYAAAGEPFNSGVLQRGALTYTDLRIVIPHAETAAGIKSFKKPKSRRGRKNVDSKIIPAIEAAALKNERFADLTRPEQCDLVRIEGVGPDVDNTKPPKNWTDSAIKARLRELYPS